MTKETLKVLREIKDHCDRYLANNHQDCKGCTYVSDDDGDSCNLSNAPLDWELPKVCKHCGEVQ